jgi:metal-responsive CopG/Arc/MetJ family transcriptional regulator
MSRITATFSISLPPEMAAELERVRKEEHRTRSELVRESLREYFRDRRRSRFRLLSQSRVGIPADLTEMDE